MKAEDLVWSAHARKRIRKRLPDGLGDVPLVRTSATTTDHLRVYATPTYAVLVLEKYGRLVPIELHAVTVITRAMAEHGSRRCPPMDLDALCRKPCPLEVKPEPPPAPPPARKMASESAVLEAIRAGCSRTVAIVKQVGVEREAVEATLEALRGRSVISRRRKRGRGARWVLNCVRAKVYGRWIELPAREGM